MCACVLSHGQLCNPMDCNLPGPFVHGIPRQEYWSGLPFSPPELVRGPLIFKVIIDIVGLKYIIFVTVLSSLHLFIVIPPIFFLIFMSLRILIDSILFPLDLSISKAHFQLLP